jgi:nitroreductase
MSTTSSRKKINIYVIDDDRWMYMDTYERITTKLESKEYEKRPVPADVKRKVLEAARQTGSGVNYQHWRFILVQDKENLKRLASDSTTGSWVANADFAVIVLTDPKYNFHLLDAGRAVQSMQLAAWNEGVTSRIYTGVNGEAMAKDFAIPKNMHISAVVGFGYPAKKIVGRKNRKPLADIAFSERYGQALNL